MREGTEAVEFLACSQARVDILMSLRQHGDMTEHELRERLDYARTTVTRNLNALHEQDWIRVSDGRYAITTCGELIVEQFINLTETTATTTQLQPFLQWVPRDNLDFDVTLLQDAELTVAEPGNPLKMVHRHVQQLKETTDLRAVVPLTGLHPYEVQHRRMLQEQLEAEHVVSPNVAETFQSDPDFVDLTRDMLNSGWFDVYVYDSNIPYYLGILDDTIQIGADEAGTPRALIETTSDEVRAWAEETYRDYKEAARPLEEKMTSADDVAEQRV
ncbi:Predicted transcriptional regulator, contains HTH domain [Halogranum amylolyticum]|uniref:Predicted transcriptional regulator, contains HTH domain n=1 Tax=Halogranum amylolyticum TaxID=660520 RepID=A0A1H8VG25_9EURY|nr:MarR family transcriptional regulator [Halogranum amylolyticum]SEP14349.1 Predicted transcriptional regulator, contains HTH domain [Halogranum amylolyticum]